MIAFCYWREVLGSTSMGQTLHLARAQPRPRSFWDPQVDSIDRSKALLGPQGLLPVKWCNSLQLIMAFCYKCPALSRRWDQLRWAKTLLWIIKLDDAERDDAGPTRPFNGMGLCTLSLINPHTILRTHTVTDTSLSKRVPATGVRCGGRRVHSRDAGSSRLL